MKKKILVAIIAAVFCCSLAVGLIVCGKKPHEHTYETDVVAPTCTEQGYTLHTCTGCGDSYKDTHVAALGHSYGEPSWTWSEDYTSATATFTCTNDGEHVEIFTATVTEKVIALATCTTDGEKDCTATATFDEQTYTDVKTVTVENTGHSLSVENVCTYCGRGASEGLDMALIGEGNTYTVSGVGTCTDTEILIPLTYNGLPVVAVNAGVFYNNTTITSVVLSDGITSIGASAFNGCSSLESVTFGKNSQLTSIGGGAFFTCTSLKSVTIPDGVTAIGEYTFSFCLSLESVTFGKNSQLTLIGNGAFYTCTSLKSVTIPDGVTAIGESAFNGCTSLESITFGKNSQLTSIGGGAFYACTSLKSVTIPAGITSIGEGAFFQCYRLVEVLDLSGTDGKDALNITAGSEDNGCVGYYAKRVETELSESYVYTDENGYVIYDDGTEKVLVGYEGTEAQLTIPEDITEINAYAFSFCYSLKSITVPDSVLSIGKEAFWECGSLESISLSDNLKSIGASAFYGCSSLTSITIPNGVTSIEENTFYYCTSLSSITIPGSVLYIGDYAFDSCSGLQSITIPDGVKSIGDYAFNNCSSLESITIPDSLTSIGSDTFYGCANLQLYNDGTAYYLGNSENQLLILMGVTSNEITSFTIDSKTKFIGNGAFRGCKNLERVDFHDGILGIGYRAFQDCDSITSITIPNGITTIGGYAFFSCNNLENIIIPDTVTFIDWCTFEGCDKLETISIPDSVTSIGGRVFYGCNSLKSIIIPGSVTAIDYEAFFLCDALTTVYYGGTAEEWEKIDINDTGNDKLTSATRYYYSETEPALNEDESAYDGNYWHCVDGTPVIWVKETV